MLTLHQGNRLNPYINYPFLPDAIAPLRAVVRNMHAAGHRVKLYFTTKVRGLGQGRLTLNLTTLTNPNTKRSPYASHEPDPDPNPNPDPNP